MRASRLLSILITLQLRGRVSAGELARQFEVSKRTIYRDADELSAAGVPIYAEPGAAGGFALLDGWQTRLTGMTAGEAQSMFLASLPGAAADLGLGTQAAGAKLKLLAALPGTSSEEARRVADRFHLDPTPWHRRTTVAPGGLRLLAQAVWQSRRVRVRYESWNGTTTRVIEPLGIVLKAGEWYFVAMRRKRVLIHKLANVSACTVLDETFRYPRGFELEKGWRKAVADFEASLRKTTARIRVSNNALSRLNQLGGDMAEPIMAAVPDANGWREASVFIESVGHAAGLILGFADNIEVLSPPELRDELARRAKAVVALYGSKNRPPSRVPKTRVHKSAGRAPHDNALLVR